MRFKILLGVLLTCIVFICLASSAFAGSVIYARINGVTGWNTMKTSSSYSLSTYVGSASSPHATICKWGQGNVDIRYYVSCTTTANVYKYAIYNINWDSDRNDCNCYGGVGDCNNGETKCWLSSKCCGDDGAADDYCGSGYTACVNGYYRTNPDSYSPACECGNAGTQGECNSNGEVGCWDSTTSDCCGDDSGEDFCAGSYTSCYNAVFRNDGDYNAYVCECGLAATQGECDSNGESGCWDSTTSDCCGDDSGEDFCAGSYTACYDGLYRDNGDYNTYLCECGLAATQGECDSNGEVGCWDSTTSACCGDDSGEDFCAGGYTSCYDSSFRNDGDYDTYVCECGFGGTQGSCDSEGEIGCWSGDGNQYNCCGDDGAADDYCSGGYTSCLDGSYYTDGDSNSETCECGSEANWDGICGDLDDHCWDTVAGECCGDDDEPDDYFYTPNVGGCVPFGGTALYDTDKPIVDDIATDTSLHYYFNKTGATTGIVYFNSDIVANEKITFTVDWTDENTGYGKDGVSALNVSGLNGGIAPNWDVSPPSHVAYTFISSDNSGILRIYARDAVYLNDSKNITFTEDTTPPTGTIIINNDDIYTDNLRVNLTLTFSDNIGVRDCAFSNDNIEWTFWQECVQNKSWSLVDEDGRRYIYYKIRDLVGNTYVANDSIFLDRSMPGIIINDNATYTNLTTVKLSLNFDYILGDTVNCSFRNDTMGWTQWGACPITPEPFHPEKSWTIENNMFGERTVSIKINTSFGVIKEANDTIIYDSQLPNGSIDIWAINVPGIQEANNHTTAYTTVNLMLEYSDNKGVKGCRFANDDNDDASFTPWETCTTPKTWVLGDEDGQRTVFYQIIDHAGNLIEYNDTISLNKTGAGLDTTHPAAPIVVDDGTWTNNNTMLHATWYGAYDKESEILNLPLVYYYSIGTSNDTDSPDATDVVGWTYAGTDTEMIHTGLNLGEGVKYYINVRTVNSADLYNDSSSDGITVDTIPCSITSLLSSTHDNGIWNNKSQSNDLQFSWTGDGGVSGVYGYSYMLDQNPDGEPDIIPEGDPEKLEEKRNTFYDNIIDGNLSFHVRCKDNAGNWGAENDYEIRIDTSRPSTPQIEYTDVMTDKTNLTFNWTESSEPHSAPVTYVFELYNSSVFNSTYLVNTTNRTQLYITVFDLVSGVTYYPRVMAWNLAELNSSWSSEVSTVIDNQGPDIYIIIPGYDSGTCNVSSLSPVIRVETDEWATCKFMKNISLNNHFDFDYTGSMYHESRTSISEEGSYKFNVECRDVIGNYADKNRTFTAVPDAVPSLISMSLEARYYTGQIAEINLTLDNKLGGVKASQFNVQIDGDNFSGEEFAITDIGCGDYILELDAPAAEGKYDIDIYADASSVSGVLTVSDLDFSIGYSSSVLQLKDDLDKLTYGASGNVTVGIATESYSSDITSEGTTLNITSNSLDASSYIFAAESTAYIRAVDIRLEEKKFSEDINPNFGAEPKDVKYSTALKLSYADAEMYGFGQLMPGRYSILIRNMGTDPYTGKQKLEIVVS